MPVHCQIEVRTLLKSLGFADVSDAFVDGAWKVFDADGSVRVKLSVVDGRETLAVSDALGMDNETVAVPDRVGKVRDNDADSVVDGTVKEKVSVRVREGIVKVLL